MGFGIFMTRSDFSFEANRDRSASDALVGPAAFGLRWFPPAEAGTRYPEAILGLWQGS